MPPRGTRSGSRDLFTELLLNRSFAPRPDPAGKTWADSSTRASTTACAAAGTAPTLEPASRWPASAPRDRAKHALGSVDDREPLRRDCRAVEDSASATGSAYSSILSNIRIRLGQRMPARVEQAQAAPASRELRIRIEDVATLLASQLRRR